ncbi:MAG: hypothetical protein IPJ77_00385 [Planctomycetes bacterium]|nr:hypothetical protein [Planctomycetota bacterium]
MTEFESLLVALAAIYLVLGVVWVRRDAFVFRAHTGRRFHVAAANALVGGEEGALQWLNPLPPFGLVHVVQPFPASVSAEGVLAWTSAAYPPGERHRQADPRFFAWSDVRRVEAREKDVLVNDVRFVRTGSTRLAAHVARFVHELAKAKPAERARRIDAELERAFDGVAIADAAGRAERGSAALVPPAVGLFLLAFVATPWVDLFGDIHAQWPWLVLALFALQAWGVVALWITAGRLEKRERWKHVLQCALSPLALIRARDGLLRDQLATFAPLAVAKALLERAEFEALLAASVRDARNPALPGCPVADPRALATEADWRARIAAAAARLAPAVAEAALAPPPPLADDCVAWCARCERQYTRADSLCAGCGDRPLVRFSRKA